METIIKEKELVQIIKEYYACTEQEQINIEPEIIKNDNEYYNNITEKYKIVYPTTVNIGSIKAPTYKEISLQEIFTIISESLENRYELKEVSMTSINNEEAYYPHQELGLRIVFEPKEELTKKLKNK